MITDFLVVVFTFCIASFSLSQWAARLVGFSEGGGGVKGLIATFFFSWLRPPKADDFLFLVAQHLLGW